MLPKDVVRLARSPRWEDRRDAAAPLAQMPSGEASGLLLDLLRDRRDTAVVKEAADVLIRVADRRAAELISAAIATADDDISDHLLYFVAAHREDMEASGLRSLFEAGRTSTDPDVRAGAVELAEYIGWRSERDH